jgi:hypothetical protein
VLRARLAGSVSRARLDHHVPIAPQGPEATVRPRARRRPRRRPRDRRPRGRAVGRDVPRADRPPCRAVPRPAEQADRDEPGWRPQDPGRHLGDQGRGQDGLCAQPRPRVRRARAPQDPPRRRRPARAESRAGAQPQSRPRPRRPAARTLQLLRSRSRQRLREPRFPRPRLARPRTERGARIDSDRAALRTFQGALPVRDPRHATGPGGDRCLGPRCPRRRLPDDGPHRVQRRPALARGDAGARGSRRQRARGVRHRRAAAGSRRGSAAELRAGARRRGGDVGG